MILLRDNISRDSAICSAASYHVWGGAGGPGILFQDGEWPLPDVDAQVRRIELTSLIIAQVSLTFSPSIKGQWE